MAKRAFQVNVPIFFACGTRVRRCSYLEVDDPSSLLDLLVKAKEGNVVAIPLRGATATAAPAATSAPGSAPEAEEPEAKAEPEAAPDWDYVTIPNMRAWLDSAGVTLPSARAGKAAHETLCREAWEGGVRPHPLYGLPGGREPAAGISTAPATEAVLETAVALCSELGIQVPAATTDALAALQAGSEHAGWADEDEAATAATAADKDE